MNFPLTNELSPNEWTFPVTRETNKLSPRYETHGQWSIDLHTNRKLLSFIILSLDYVFTWVSLYPLGILNCTITHLICYISSRDVVYPISLSLSLSLFLFIFVPLIFVLSSVFLCILYTTSLTPCVTIDLKPTRSKCVGKRKRRKK